MIFQNLILAFVDQRRIMSKSSYEVKQILHYSLPYLYFVIHDLTKHVVETLKISSSEVE